MKVPRIKLHLLYATTSLLVLFNCVEPLTAKTQSLENVTNYFEVAQVGNRLLYFNYRDMFPNEPLPPYAINYDTFGNPQLITAVNHCYGIGNGASESPLIKGILAGLIVFLSVNKNQGFEMIGPYSLPSPSDDSTKLGSNIKPNFWIDL